MHFIYIITISVLEKVWVIVASFVLIQISTVGVLVCLADVTSSCFHIKIETNLFLLSVLLHYFPVVQRPIRTRLCLNSTFSFLNYLCMNRSYMHKLVIVSFLKHLNLTLFVIFCIFVWRCYSFSVFYSMYIGCVIFCWPNVLNDNQFN